MAEAIRATNLVCSYGSAPVIEDVTFSVEEGSYLAIVGPNGSGKSTLVKAMLGLLEPTSGSIELLGKAPSSVPASAVGYIPQMKTFDPTYPAMTLELVLTGMTVSWPFWIRREEREACLAALRRVGIEHLADHSVGTLSGGELQRAYLARTIVRKPRVIILDEPATGIDFVGEVDLYRLLGDLQKDSGATVVMVTHDLTVAEHHASHVLLMNNHAVSFGPPAEALKEEYLSRAFGHLGHKHDGHH